MKYLKQYGVENLKPGDILIISNGIVVFLDYTKTTIQGGWKQYAKHLIRFKNLYDLFYGEVDDLNGYDGWHSFKFTRYESVIDAIIKLDDEMLPREFIETRDKIMENPKLQKKLLKWSLGK